MRNIVALKPSLTASRLQKLSLSLAFGIITGLSSRFIITLPFSPVPITLQTFFVIGAGLFLGSYFGALSQMIFIVLGLTGAGFAGGLTLLSPTGGYIIGFLLTAFIAGGLSRLNISESSLTLSALLFTAAIFLIYIPGIVQLGLVTGIRDIQILFNMGVMPFIPGDIMKVVLISFIFNAFRKLVDIDS
ncbi:MAG: biotin transporter BioY [candidate division WOR-3 bacterium]|nr:biotin transporter BioY [candidate division WOR-3 bacterium]